MYKSLNCLLIDRYDRLQGSTFDMALEGVYYQICIEKHWAVLDPEVRFE